MYWSDEAIICTNPETSSVRDSDKMIGIILRFLLFSIFVYLLCLPYCLNCSKSKKAMQGGDVKLHLLITRYSAERAESGGMLPVNDIVEMLGVCFLYNLSLLFPSFSSFFFLPFFFLYYHSFFVFSFLVSPARIFSRSLQI